MTSARDLDRIIDYMNLTAKQAIERALSQMKQPMLNPGTVLSVDPTTATCTVAPDGSPGVSISCQILTVQPRVSERVMVLLQPPHGAFVIGFTQGDLDMGRGLLASRFHHADDFTTTTTTLAQIPDLSAGVNVMQRRVVKLTMCIRGCYSSVADDKIEIFLTRDFTDPSAVTVGSGILDTGHIALNGSAGTTITAYDIDPPAGGHTYAAWWNRAAGTGICHLSPTSYAPLRLLVEDDGSALMLDNQGT